MRLSDTQWEFMLDLAEMINYAETKGYKLTGGELKRPRAMQLLYYYGKNLKYVGGILKLITSRTLTDTLNSDHLRGLAIDLNIFYDTDGDDYKEYTGNMPNARAIAADLGDYWCSLNPANYWGGRFKGGWDVNHFGRRR